MNGFKYAIKMENDGEKYYREQAEINKDNPLNTVFLFLANEEASHADILEKKMKEMNYEIQENEAYSKYRNIFVDVDNLDDEIKKLSMQLDAYKMAVEMEKKSMALYEELLADSKDKNSREIFEYLIDQEKQHLAIFEDLVKLVKNPEEWVEFAEFGQRGEY